MRWEKKLQGHVPTSCWDSIVTGRPWILTSGKLKLWWRWQYWRSSLRKRGSWILEGGKKCQTLGGSRVGRSLQNKESLKFLEFLSRMLDPWLGWPFEGSLDKDNGIRGSKQDQDKIISFRQCPRILEVNTRITICMYLSPLYFWQQAIEVPAERSLNYEEYFSSHKTRS